MSLSYLVYFRGKPACPCLARWIPFYERELRARGLLPKGGTLTIFQLIGLAAASANTHKFGGALDDAHYDDLSIWVARQMGADASWARVTMSPKHGHKVLRGCPHLHPEALAQIADVDRNDNGLVGSLPDDGPRPLSYRTWEQGIVWHQEQQRIRRRAALSARIQPLVEQKVALQGQVAQISAKITRLREKRDAA